MSADRPLRGLAPLCYLGRSRLLSLGALSSCPPARPLEESPSCPVDAPRTRRSFARLDKVLDVPNLIDIQRRSFEWLVDPENGGLRETIDDISPIEDYTGHLAVNFGEFDFDEPAASIEECREKDLTYSRPLTVTVAFINHETGEIREQSVFMGDFPWMTERGTFIINGTERVVVTQLVRSPGAYVMEPKDREKQVFTANLMPRAAPWLELEIDKKGKVFVRIDRKRKLPVTVLLRAMTYNPETDADVEETHEDVERLDQELVDLFDGSLYIRNTVESDTDNTTTKGALIELFKKQRPGEPPSVDAAYALLQQLFFDPKRYDLTRVGRYKLNSRLGLDIDLDTRTLTHDDIHALVKELISLPRLLGIPEDGEVEIKDYAAEAVSLPREPVADHLDEYEHFGNRRLRTVGELIQEAFRDRPLPDGARRPRAPDDRGRGHDHAADDREHPPGRGGAEGVLRLLAALAVHGPDELAGRPDPPPPPLGARRGRPDPRARPDRGARRPPDALRPHVPDRDAGGSEHRPDRLAVELRAGLRARLRHDALPRRRRRAADRRDRPPRRHAGGGQPDRAGEHAPRKDGSSTPTRSSAARRPASTSRSPPPTSTSWTSRPSRSGPSPRR